MGKGRNRNAKKVMDVFGKTAKEIRAAFKSTGQNKTHSLLKLKFFKKDVFGKNHYKMTIRRKIGK